MALFEQAQYQFQADPESPTTAADLLRQAIDALPIIQKQKGEALAFPYQVRLARYLAAAGDKPQADAILHRILPPDAAQLGPLLESPAADGLDDSDLQFLRDFRR